MICVQDLTIHAGGFCLSGISFEVPSGEYGILMGKTGSGKTTLLEAICGLKRVSSGKVFLDGKDVTHLKPASRGIGFVAQEGALFTSMTVRDHLAFALTIRRRPKAEIDERVAEMASLLGIESLLDRKPPGLSGGERQRVSLGRALSFHPGILCLDEPLSALDDETKEEMYDLLLAVQRQTGVTVLHVTHNRLAADKLSSRVFLLKDGAILSKEVAPISHQPKGEGEGGGNLG